MQMRRVVTRIAGDSHCADRVAALQHHALSQTLRVVVEVRVVVGKLLGRVELVYGEPASNAAKELDYATVPGSDDLRASRSRNVQRFVQVASASLVVRISQVLLGDAHHRDSQTIRCQALRIGCGEARSIAADACATKSRRRQGAGT